MYKVIADQEQPCSSTAAQDRATQSPTLRRTPTETVRNHHASESVQHRERRLAQERARRRERLASESAEERAARLYRRRVGSLPLTKNAQHSHCSFMKGCCAVIVELYIIPVQSTDMIIEPTRVCMEYMYMYISHDLGYSYEDNPT